MRKSYWAVYALVCLAFCNVVASASAEWKENVLYSFQGNTDGATPIGAIVFDKKGNLYGATRDGGAPTCPSVQQCGTIYQLTPPVKQGDPWTETVLYVFQGKNNNNDGASPYGGLLIDRSGNLYGTTGYGGTGNCVVLGVLTGCGTVFELSPPQQKGGTWTETILYNFRSGSDGYVPWGDLAVDNAGNIYGATEFGGGLGESNNCDNEFYAYCGTIFELSPPAKKGQPWTEKVLHSFSGLLSAASMVGDGANPVGGLVLDSKGALYGTTNIGGYNCPHNENWGCGSVFKLTRPAKKNGAWTESILYRFRGPFGTPADGCLPFAGVVLGKTGTIYGTTSQGGEGNADGTVFSLAPNAKGKWDEVILHSFHFSDGSAPWGGLTFDTNGDLLGTTSASGSARGGTAFRLREAVNKTWQSTVLYNFSGKPDGAFPSSGLLPHGIGNYFGTTREGGNSQACGNYGCGTVFSTRP